MKFAIVDYGMGNIHSLKSALDYVSPDAEIILTSDHQGLLEADMIFLPGVGHFKSAMDKLEDLGLVQSLRQLVLKENKPILGICLGMQLLFKDSNEGGVNPGLALLDAEVRDIPSGKEKVPHIGFNTVSPPKEGKMFDQIENLDFYFVHSFCINDSEIEGAHKTLCDYNSRFVAAVEKGHIWGTQFHPEKSQYGGLKLIQNFIEAHGN